MLKKLLVILGFLIFSCGVQHRQGTTNHYVIAFYNTENLFDTINDPLTRDDDKTPGGRDRWNHQRYRKKIRSLTSAITGIGSGLQNQAPVILGLCEIENKRVLLDLIAQLRAAGFEYGFVHEDSPDERGIDVALLYREDAFQPIHHEVKGVRIKTVNSFLDHSRDILVVKGWLLKQPLYLLINHWPSRSGGQLRSNAYRLHAARMHKTITDSILALDRQARILSMGDYNDNPDDESLLQLSESRLPGGGMYNLMKNLYKQGYGSLAYRDRWYLFDQILVNNNFLQDSSLRIAGVGIHNPSYLSTPAGPYKGYPWRTYASGRYSGGYSDHFPVFIRLDLCEPLVPGDAAEDEH